jgi:hypothetical protein
MKTYSIMALVLALTPTLAMAVPDFSGTWVRDIGKSDPPGYPAYWVTRSAPTGFGGGGDPVMDVRQSATSLQVTLTNRPLRNYALDGKPRMVPADTGLQTATVTASADSDAVTIATSQPFGGLPGNVTMKATETWRLSADGKVLTLTTVRETPAKQQTFKEVYNRK